MRPSSRPSAGAVWPAPRSATHCGPTPWSTPCTAPPPTGVLRRRRQSEQSRGVTAGAPLRQQILGQFDYRFQRLLISHTFDGIGNTLVAIALAGTLFFSIPAGEA